MGRSGELCHLSLRRLRCHRPLVREWVALELFGHVGLIVLRQLCGTRWSWRTGGPFAYIDVSRAMLHGDAFWVVAVVCTSAIRLGLLAEWGHSQAGIVPLALLLANLMAIVSSYQAATGSARRRAKGERGGLRRDRPSDHSPRRRKLSPVAARMWPRWTFGWSR